MKNNKNGDTGPTPGLVVQARKFLTPPPIWAVGPTLRKSKKKGGGQSPQPATTATRVTCREM